VRTHLVVDLVRVPFLLHPPCPPLERDRSSLQILHDPHSSTTVDMNWSIVLSLLLALSQVALALPLYGCNLSDDLCDESEVCFSDNLFGQCYAPSGRLPPPTVLGDLNEVQLELLRLELTRLAEQGNDWADTRSQCVLAYFKLSMAYDLQYDPEFCQARDPANIWALIQLIELGLKEEPALVDDNPDQVVVPVLIDDGDDNDEELQKRLDESEALSADAIDGLSDNQVEEIINELHEPMPDIEEEAIATLPLPDLSTADAAVVSAYLQDIINQKRPDLSQLSDEQLNVLIASILELKAEYEAKEATDGNEEKKEEKKEEAPTGEVEDQIAVDEKSEQNMLKKDVEKVGDVRTGLNPNVHNIVKGRRSDISRVVGNRVYLKVNIKEEEQLMPLIEFLQNTIALPNNLIFDDFNFEDGQLSLRISRAPPEIVEELKEDHPKDKRVDDKRIDTVEGVAQAVYKRRKDIAQFSGAEVAETGIGIGEDSVPVASNDQEWFVVPLLFVSIFTITSLTGVLAVHLYKRRRGNYAANIRQLADAVDGKSDSVYQELCRQRMSQDPIQSKTSSTSSWVEDEKAAIDISTGHVLLNFLQSSLSDPAKIDSQWEAIKDYRDKTKSTATAERNASGNRAVIPYDETLVTISSDEQSTSAEEYLNASFLYDDDPRQAAFIACQSPLGTQFAAFWRAVWQQGVNLIVNLSTLEESRQDAYWPEKGSECHAEFEIHLVSEHIWSDDYLVRSFYLKNLKDGQTRTITQFHFVSWKANEAPSTPKSLLEFRRKVNKSYRGRCSPLLVHSIEGAGRAGVYCAVDVICQRIQRGVKEIDVVASVEHIRDQRPSMVKTADQFKFIYACVAQEVSALLK
ncbi:hypothetical protein PFISCL1PPCAC_10722, partial [Pristionchus fissidentatus]